MQIIRKQAKIDTSKLDKLLSELPDYTQRPFSSEEEGLIKKYYGVKKCKDIARILGKKISQVRHFAKTRGLQRDR